MELFELLLNSLAITGVRSDQMEGEDCWVVPATILREGVYPGSEGPLFYSGKVNKKSARAWNGIPIVVNHPQNQAGQFISARSQAVLEERGIGLVLNSGTTKEGALVIEAWIRKERARSIVPSLATTLEAAEAGTTVSPVNLSTGLFPTFVANAGEYNGRSYTAEVSAMEPDHLAILMDRPGACSVTDGCGLGIVANVAVTVENHLVVNAEASFDEIVQALARAINDEISSNAYLEAVYPTTCIFSLSGRKYYRQAYTFANGTAKLSGAYTPVTRQVTYTPTLTNNQREVETTMSTTQPAACTCGGQPTQTAAAPVANANPAPATPTAAPAVVAPVANANFLDSLTPDQRQQINDAMALSARVRSGLVANVKANPNNRFSDEELAALPTAMLEKIAGSMAPVTNAAADPLTALLNGTVYTPTPAPVVNAQQLAQQQIDQRGRGIGAAAPVVNAQTAAPTQRRTLSLPSSVPTPAA